MRSANLNLNKMINPDPEHCPHKEHLFPGVEHPREKTLKLTVSRKDPRRARMWINRAGLPYPTRRWTKCLKRKAKRSFNLTELQHPGKHDPTV